MPDTLMESASATPTDSRKPLSSRRLMSLDALRGFDMFWIVGGEELVHGLYKWKPGRITGFLDYELDHASWAGFHFYDLIFPLFVFMAGVSIVFSLTRIVQEHGRLGAIRRILIRSLVLYFFGLLVYGGISRGLDQVRWMGVLQRIAISYCCAGLLFICFKPRALAGVCVGLLVGYWALTALVPIRNFNLETTHLRERQLRPNDPETRAQFLATTEYVRGKYDDGLNLPQQVDFLYLPGHRWDGAYDPEGLLSTMGAVVTCLLGVFAGLLLRAPQLSDSRKVRILLAAGIAGVLLAWTWNLSFPVIKKIWTSSYVLAAGGYSCLLLAAFYQIVEIWNYRKWTLPFVWIGMNSITIYLFFHLIDFGKFAQLIAGGPVRKAFGPAGDFMLACVVVALMLLLVRLLYNRKVFLRL